MKEKFKIKPGSRGNLIRVAGAVLGIGIVFTTMVNISNSKVETVDIVLAKTDIGVNRLILDNNVYKGQTSKAAYDLSKDKFLLWEEKDEAINKYSTVSLKESRPLYKEDYKDKKSLKNEWLSKVEEGQVIVSLPYNKSESFGNILTPGDTVIVQATYKETNTDGYGGQTDVSKELYERAKVIDLLNAQGNSIYDYYVDLLDLSLEEREKLLRDESFLKNVSPIRILYAVPKANGFKNYADIQGKSGLKIIYGLYPREEGDTVLDQFSDLTRQFSSALTQTGSSSDSGGN